MSNVKTVATIHAPRSKHDLSHSVKTSASVGTLYPVYVQEIYPGDSIKCNTSFVARLTSSYLRPVMDNLFCDIYYFFVPHRLCYDRFEEVFGENRKTAWAQREEVSMPQFPDGCVCVSKSVLDYLGVPLGDIPQGAQFILPRAFALIYDQWFRDENLIDPMFVNTGDYDEETEAPNSSPWSPNNYTGMLPKVAKFHDIFTSALPSTQKSDSPVYVPLAGFVPLQTSSALNDIAQPIRFATTATNGAALNYWSGGNVIGNGARTLEGITSATTTPAETYTINGTNMGINLSDAGVLTVPDMRYAFALQQILEREARSGSRYTEYIYSTFGVRSPDARLQRAEFLGGKRVPLSLQQVAQTTRGDTEVTELGQLGAYSLTNGSLGFSKSFVEHGYIIGCMCIRQHHTYQQGLAKHWQRVDRFDFHDPTFDHISEIPVYKSELYAPGQTQVKGDIFGYQEYGYDLRQRNSYVTGEMRSDAQNSLDIWHFGDDYAGSPYLNKQFIEETPEYVDRTIAVPSTSLDQFIFDIYHDVSAIRRIAVRSTPGMNYL